MNIKNFNEYIKEDYQTKLYPNDISEKDILTQFLDNYAISKKEIITSNQNSYQSVKPLFVNKSDYFTDYLINNIIDDGGNHVTISKLIVVEYINKKIEEPYKESFLKEVNYSKPYMFIGELKELFPKSFLEDMFYFIKNNNILLETFVEDTTNLKWLEKFVDDNNSNKELIVYRALSLTKDQKDVDNKKFIYEGVGQFWTYDFKSAISHFSKTGDNDVDIFLVGKANWSDIDWNKTIERSLYAYSSESEIFIKPNANLLMDHAYIKINYDIKNMMDKYKDISNFTVERGRIKVEFDEPMFIKIGNSEDIDH